MAPSSYGLEPPQNPGRFSPFIHKAPPKGSDKPKTFVEIAAKADKPAREGSKMEKAAAVYLKMKGQPRKDVLAAFQKDAGLTKAGSGTYFALLKKKHG